MEWCGLSCSLGDRERAEGLPISPNCDRATVDVNKSQAGFLEFLVLPFFKCAGAGRADVSGE